MQICICRVRVEYRTIEEWCEILDSQRIPITAKNRIEGPYPYYGANGIQGYVNDYIFDDELVLLAEDGGNFGSKDRPIAYRVSGKCWVNNHAHVLKPKNDLNVDYLCYSLMFYNTNGLVNGATRQKLPQSTMRKMKIPYLEINKQQEIVQKIKKIESILSDLNGQLDLLDELVKARFVEMFGEIEDCDKWESKIWNEVVTIKNGRDYKKVLVSDGGYPVVGTGGEIARASKYLCPENTIVVGRKGSINNPMLMKEKFWNVDTAFGVIPNSDYLHYQYFYCFCKFYNFMKLNKATTLPSTTKADLLKIRINIPPLELQNQFASFVEEVDKSRLHEQLAVEYVKLLAKDL